MLKWKISLNSFPALALAAAILVTALAGTLVMTTPTDAAGAQSMTGVRIAIDPGHGGKDPGAVGPTGLTEQSVNLQVAQHLQNCLEEYGNATTMLTRTSDTYVPLIERANKANSWGAHRFISIHHNGHTNKWVNGTEVYSYTRGSNQSHDLRDKIQDRLIQVYGLKDLRAKTASFSVLRNSAMPAVLTEASFITNPYEEARLKRPEYLWRQAFYIYLGVADHLGLNP